MRRHAAVVLVGLILLGTAPCARADDVTDQIDEARKAYDAKDLATSSGSHPPAARLILIQSEK
jgi:hypothetical protein